MHTCQHSSKNSIPLPMLLLIALRYLLKYPHLCLYSHFTFSSYKHHNTFNGLIGICPTEAVTFISQLYVGSISDQALTCDCGILELIEPGDSIMADKGFDIAYDVPLCFQYRTLYWKRYTCWMRSGDKTSHSLASFTCLPHFYLLFVHSQ